jgi:anti-sigma B factor antagonist
MTESADPEEGFSVVRLLGEADAYSAPRVRDDLAAALGGEAPLVIDLTRATFVDSTIMGVMLESLKRCEQLDRKFLLLLPADGAPEIHRLFKLTGLEKLLPVVRSWEEAAERLVAQ